MDYLDLEWPLDPRRNFTMPASRLFVGGVKMRFCRRSRSVPIVLFSVLALAGAMASPGAMAGQAPPAGSGVSLPLAFVTYIHLPYQESAARALIECVRTWGGEYRGSPIYVVVTDPGYLAGGLEDKDVTRVPLEVGEPLRSFPYAVKARAAAAVEALVAGKVRSLAWFDPETLLFGPPKEMDLGEGAAAAVAPVQFINTGQPPDAPVDAYWGGIYGRVGLDPSRVFTVETRVDRRTVRAYLNCGMFAVRPERGLMREWAKVQDELLYCHGVDFTPGTGGTYRVPADMRPARLNDLATVFYEGLFRQRPDWADLIPPADEPLRSWLRDLVEKRLGGKR
jgi:hypothetical protein